MKKAIDFSFVFGPWRRLLPSTPNLPVVYSYHATVAEFQGWVGLIFRHVTRISKGQRSMPSACTLRQRWKEVSIWFRSSLLDHSRPVAWTVTAQTNESSVVMESSPGSHHSLGKKYWMLLLHFSHFCIKQPIFGPCYRIFRPTLEPICLSWCWCPEFRLMLTNNFQHASMLTPRYSFKSKVQPVSVK